MEKGKSNILFRRKYLKNIIIFKNLTESGLEVALEEDLEASQEANLGAREEAGVEGGMEAVLEAG